MSQIIKGKRITSIGFYLGVAILVAFVWGIQAYIYHISFDGPGRIFSESAGVPSGLDDWDKMMVQTMSDLNKLLTTLATALFGAIGLLITNNGKRGPDAPKMWSLYLSAAAGGLSLYFGYVTSCNLLAMLRDQKIDPGAPVYLNYAQSQFYSLLIATFFLAHFAVHDQNRSR